MTRLVGGTQDPHELFVGRTEQVERLLDLLAPVQANGESVPRAVVVSAVAGMGGIGKTALARHTATLAVVQGWFTGGVLFVDLRGYDLHDDPVQPEQVFAPMLWVLGVPGERIPATVDEQATVYHQVLGEFAEQGRRVLVVLDNASAGKQVSDLLPRHRVHRALVTTRDTLALRSAHQLKLDVLDIDEALELLAHIVTRRQAGDTRVAREQDPAVRLVTVCGALPLAVEITASILADEPGMTINDLVTELTDGPGVHRVRHGERALATVFDVSWRRLCARAPEAAELLSLLTLNPGPDFHTDTAAAVAGRPAVHVAPWLRVLQHASLLRYDGRRWSMHDVIRLHAQDHLDSQHQNRATSQLLEYYQRTSKAADDHLRALPGDPVPDRFSSRQDALAWFDTERANLTAAVALALDTGHYLLTTHLAANLNQYFFWRRRLTEQVGVNEHALTAAQHIDSPRALANAWNYLGIALQEVRRVEEAITAYQSAVAIYRKLDDRHNEGIAQNNLGVALREVRRFEEAITVHQTVVAVFRELGDRRSESAALNNLGTTLREVRRFEEAITVHQTAVGIHRELGDRHNEGMALVSLGLVLWDVRRFEEAITVHQTAVAIHRELGDRHNEGIALNSLGIALREVRRFEEAITAYQSAVAIHRELGDRHREGAALNSLGIALWDVRRFEEEITAYQSAVAIHRELGDRHREGAAQNNLGIALREVRRFEEAITAYQSAVAIYREVGDRHREGAALTNLGIALRDSGLLDEAKDVLQNAVAALRKAGDTRSEAIVTDWLDELS